jgi:hypothetical protein
MRVAYVVFGLLGIVNVWLLLDRFKASGKPEELCVLRPLRQPETPHAEIHASDAKPVAKIIPLAKTENSESLRYVVFSLYGNETLFTIGAVRNAQLAKQVRVLIHETPN